ncbi:hypothetical protein BT69DRAFT_1365004, partial [Atractiella rhizophila]
HAFRGNRSQGVVGPIVDTIGKLERSDCMLADAVLELLRLAKHFDQMDLEQEEDSDIGWENLFVEYAVLCFKNRFHTIDSDLLFVALYLHPMCHGIAVSQHIANSRNLTDRWKLSSKASALLCDNVDKYHNFEGKFAETSVNALKYWEGLALPPSQYPLISVAIRIFSVVPHAGVIEISKLKQLVVIKRWTTYNKREKGEGKEFEQRKGGRQDEFETQTVEEIEDLEEAVSADEDLVSNLQQELKKAKEERAEATRLGREHLPRPSDCYDLIAYDVMLQNGTVAKMMRPSLPEHQDTTDSAPWKVNEILQVNLAKSQQRHGNEEHFSRSEGGSSSVVHIPAAFPMVQRVEDSGSDVVSKRARLKLTI